MNADAKLNRVWWMLRLYVLRPAIAITLIPHSDMKPDYCGAPLCRQEQRPSFFRLARASIYLAPPIYHVLQRLHARVAIRGNSRGAARRSGRHFQEFLSLL